MQAWEKSRSRREKVLKARAKPLAADFLPIRDICLQDLLHLTGKQHKRRFIYETTQTQYLPWCGGYRSFTVYPVSECPNPCGWWERHVHCHRRGQERRGRFEYPEGQCAAFSGQGSQADWRLEERRGTLP